MSRTRGPDGADGAATTLQQLAVLLEAGIAPMRAWQLLAETGDATAVAATVGSPASDTAQALAAQGGVWREVAVAWRVAHTVGAPLAMSLRQFAVALRDAQETRDDIAVALADPAATARLVAWLPLVAVGLALVLGFDVAVVFSQPVGIACLLAGATLMIAARHWTGRLVVAAQPAAGLVGLQADVVAIALSGGVSIERALAVVDSAGGGAVDAATSAALSLSERAGAPAVELLRGAAAEAR
ncbi:MAG: type II secretion system F family protein, partial [Microbacterium sp.]